MAIDSAKTIVLVTGANRGIGVEIVAALLRSTHSPTGASGAPFHIYLASRTFSKGKTALEALQPSPHNSVSLLHFDVTSATSIASAVSTVQSEAGRLDILINNAGIISTAADSTARLRETLKANLVAPYALTEAFKPLLLSKPHTGGRKDKRLIHIISDLGSISKRTDPADTLYHSPFPEYRISKAALNMMAACHQAEMMEAGVKVVAFNPGYSVTALTGEEQVEMRRQRGARDPKVCGEACVGIVEGRRDGEANKLVDVEGVLPWCEVCCVNEVLFADSSIEK